MNKFFNVEINHTPAGSDEPQKVVLAVPASNTTAALRVARRRFSRSVVHSAEIDWSGNGLPYPEDNDEWQQWILNGMLNEKPTSKPVPYFANQEDLVVWMRENAEEYRATLFRGYPKFFDTKVAKSLDEARKLAISMFVDDRPIMIYGCHGTRQVHLENYYGNKVVEDSEVNSEVETEGENELQARGTEVPVEVAQAPTEPKATRTPRVPVVGKFRKAHPRGRLGQIYTHIESGTSEIDSLASAMGLTADEVEGALKAGRRSHGVDYKCVSITDSTGDEVSEHWRLIYPEGQNTAVLPPKEPKEPSDTAPGPVTKRAVRGAAEAMTGVMPAPPDFTANTHKPWRKKLEALQALVEARDLNGLRAWHVNPISTSPRALMRYRDNAILAIEAQAKQEAQEEEVEHAE